MRESRCITFGLVIIALGTMTGCRRTDGPGAPIQALDYLQPQAIGAPVEGRPWIAHVSIVDLDHDGRNEILVCDAGKNQVTWCRRTPSGDFVEEALATDLPAPVHAAVADLDGDGDSDVLVACMGLVPPNNDKIGSVIVLENDGSESFTPRVLLENVARVTDVQAADLNGDGLLDLAVAQFGYYEGEIRWMENTGGWNFTSHQLLDRAGAINVCIADMNADNTPDIVSVVGQQWEEVYLFSNNGRGVFTPKVIFGSANEDYGSSGISLADVNRDGRPDVLYSNGDGFDERPGPKAWHGVQWLENSGGGSFAFHRLGDLPGAFSPVGVDFDRDGDTDVLAVGCFSAWTDPKDKVQTGSLLWFRNDGERGFTPVTLATNPTHLLTAAAGDLDGDGRPEIVTGGFYAFPPFKEMRRLMLWEEQRDSP